MITSPFPFLPSSPSIQSIMLINDSSTKILLNSLENACVLRTELYKLIEGGASVLITLPLFLVTKFLREIFCLQ